MKLATGLFQDVIDIDEGAAVSLIIEKPDMYYRFLKEMYDQIEGNDGEFILSEESEILKISKKIELLTSLIPLV